MTVKEINGEFFYTAKSGKFVPYVKGLVRGAIPEMIKELEGLRVDIPKKLTAHKRKGLKS